MAQLIRYSIEQIDYNYFFIWLCSLNAVLIRNRAMLQWNCFLIHYTVDSLINYPLFFIFL